MRCAVSPGRRGVFSVPWAARWGRLLYRLMRRRRGIAEANLALCFPWLDEATRARIRSSPLPIPGTRDHRDRDRLVGAAMSRIAARARIIGSEHLETALSHGKGVLLFGGHFTTFEIGGRILASRFAVGATYRPHDDPWWDSTLRAGRTRYLSELVAHKDARAMVRYLGRNRILWYAPDQDYGGRRRVFARFFAECASTTTATAWLARKSGARVVPYASRRRVDDSGWDVVLGPALDDFPSGDDLADAERLNAVLEAEIERNIEQYLWVHRRFKTRPPGAAPAYAPVLLRRRSGNG